MLHFVLERIEKIEEESSVEGGLEDYNDTLGTLN